MGGRNPGVGASQGRAGTEVIAVVGAPDGGKWGPAATIRRC